MNFSIDALTLALSTLVLEDGTTIAGGLMVCEGRMSFWLAFLALSFGITCGDCGLYAVGYLAGRWRPLRRLVGQERMASAHRWADSHLGRTLLAARLMPAARTPVYLAAGIVHASVRRFVLYTIAASMAYVFVLLHLTIWAGQAIGLRIGPWKWAVAAAVPVGLLACKLARRAMRPQPASAPEETQALSPAA